MTEVMSGDLADVPAPVNMRRVLPAVEMRGVVAGIEHVLAEAPAGREAVFVAHYLAPTLAEQAHDLADARLQLGQAGAALAKAMATSMEVAAQAAWVAGLAHARAVVAHRLRTELWEALPDAERFRTLTEQRCPVGLHTGWYAPSNGVQHRCPWCQIDQLSGQVEPDRAPAEPLDEDALERALIAPGPDGECPAHGPHPHAQLKCLDCVACQDGAADSDEHPAPTPLPCEVDGCTYYAIDAVDLCQHEALAHQAGGS
ncbi:hypothetical protein [Actinophytocola sp.]|uniref:hypothetical protein n=1 Tax=Actinophytocola sp. TaxID=1872138 RepID=UPI002D604924|nr:hypothetical protein [Actinophytocola sp.]HYQ69659.1 hypothetical protein [Actinophytocola sp.]